MWKVYVDDYLIYLASSEELKIYNAKLDLELNKTGAFEFTIYPNHPYFTKLQKLKSIVKVYWNDYLMFRGRILNDPSSFHNEKKVQCEGELAFLLDTHQRPYDFQSGDNHTTISEFFTYLIENHNSQVEEEKQFKVGNITVTDENDYIVRADSTYMNTWDSIQSKLIETNGGYIWVRREEDGNYIDYLEDFDILANQTIEFGKNLLDFNKIAKGEDIGTVLIPLGAETDGVKLTVASVNDGKDYIINQEAIDKYGWIEKVVVWDDVTEASNLLTKGNAYLNDIINLIVSLELNAVDLAGTSQDYSTINSFRLGTYVKVISKPHDVNSNFLVTKLSIGLQNPKSNRLVLGKSYKTFTEKTAASNAIQKEIVNVIKGTATTEELKDAIIETESRASSMVTQSVEEVLIKVSEDYYLKSDAETLVQSISTEFKQTNESFEMRFNQFNADVEALASGTNAQFQEINKYIRFIDGNIILGEEGNQITLKISNDRISFLQNSAEVAYFSNNKLYVKDGEYLNSLRIGKLAIVPRKNGSIAVKVE